MKKAAMLAALSVCNLIIYIWRIGKIGIMEETE